MNARHSPAATLSIQSIGSCRMDFCRSRKSFTSICVTSPVDLIHERSPPEAFWKKVERSDKRRWEKHFSLVGLMQPHTLVLYLKENVGAHNKKNNIYVDTDAQGSVAESTVASIGTDWLVCLGFIRDADNDTHTHTEHLTTQFLIKKRGRTNQWAWTDHVSISAYDDGWDDGLLTAVSLRRSLRCPRFLSEALQLSVEAWWAPEDEPARFRSLAHQMKTCNLPVI